MSPFRDFYPVFFYPDRYFYHCPIVLQTQHRECGGHPGVGSSTGNAGVAVPSWGTKRSCAAALPRTLGQKTGYSLVKTSKHPVSAAPPGLGRAERTRLQSFALASLTGFFFFFFWWKCIHIGESCAGKGSAGAEREGEGCGTGHGESGRSFPFVPALGFRPACAPAPASTLARSRRLFCRGIFLWELLLHCTAN